MLTPRTLRTAVVGLCCLVALTPSAPALASSTEPSTAPAVSIVGDSLVYGREEIYVAALERAGFQAYANGVGSRAIRYGWQCRDDTGRLVVVAKPFSGKCRREGLEQLRHLRTTGALGTHVVLALGTNDSGLYDAKASRRNLNEVRRVVGDRHLWLVTIVKGGRPSAPRWNHVITEWCAKDSACSVIDWASSRHGRSRSSYVADGVHLTQKGAAARAALIAAALEEGAAAGLRSAP